MNLLIQHLPTFDEAGEVTFTTGRSSHSAPGAEKTLLALSESRLTSCHAAGNRISANPIWAKWGRFGIKPAHLSPLSGISGHWYEVPGRMMVRDFRNRASETAAAVHQVDAKGLRGTGRGTWNAEQLSTILHLGQHPS
jgi:hypothetical protein